MIKCMSGWLLQISGMIPANRSVPFRYTSRLTTTIVTINVGVISGCGLKKYIRTFV